MARVGKWSQHKLLRDPGSLKNHHPAWKCHWQRQLTCGVGEEEKRMSRKPVSTQISLHPLGPLSLLLPTAGFWGPSATQRSQCPTYQKSRLQISAGLLPVYSPCGHFLSTIYLRRTVIGIALKMREAPGWLLRHTYRWPVALVKMHVQVGVWDSACYQAPGWWRLWCQATLTAARD